MPGTENPGIFLICQALLQTERLVRNQQNIGAYIWAYYPVNHCNFITSASQFGVLHGFVHILRRFCLYSPDAHDIMATEKCRSEVSYLKIAICDDDALCRDQILSIVKTYIKQKNRDISVSVFDRATALIDVAQRFGGYDIYLLDIIMPGINGIKLGVELRQFDPDGKILYLTSGLEFAYESYQAKAFDYILKPIHQERLFSALDDAIRTIANRKEKSLIVKTRENRVKLTMDNILYAKLVDRRVAYYLLDGDIIESNSIRTTFAEYIQDLLADSRFVLCGSSIAVNLYHVTKADYETLFFKNGTQLYIGKRAGRDILSVWSDFWLNGEGNK